MYRVGFDIDNNADFSEAFDLVDDAGDPQDLTGATFRMTIEDAAGVERKTLTIGDGIAVGPSAGRITLSIAATVLDDWPLGVYRHDMLMIAGGTTRAIWTGTLTLNRGVTDV